MSRECKKCGDDSGWSALDAEVESYLAKAGFRIPDDSLSADDYCPECLWELVTGNEPTVDLLPTMLTKRGYGVVNAPAGKYGPYDDTSPGHENATRAREGD